MPQNMTGMPGNGSGRSILSMPQKETESHPSSRQCVTQVPPSRHCLGWGGELPFSYPVAQGFSGFQSRANGRSEIWIGMEGFRGFVSELLPAPASASSWAHASRGLKLHPLMAEFGSNGS